MQRAAEESLSLIAAISKVLHANGQQTDETIHLVRRLAQRLGISVVLCPAWGHVLLQGEMRPGSLSAELLEATPTNVGMNRVVAAGAVAQRVIAGDLSPGAAEREIDLVASIPPFSHALFAAACAAGAVALAVTFGVAHLTAIAAIFVSAGLGGLLRRLVAGHGANAFAQAFVAALLAGVIGGASVRWGISSELRLIAVCPCMVLVPGPHLLNGALDLLGNRIPLGVSRLLFAGMTLAAVTAGLLIGLAVCGVTLPAAPPGRDVTVLAASVAGASLAACFGVFFALPMRFVGLPMMTAVAADALRWCVMTGLHAGPVTGAAAAGLVAGAVLTPVSRRLHLPFAGIGFASVVSLMPGTLVFRMSGGILALQTVPSADVVPLMRATGADGLTALLVIAAMTVSIVLPKHVYDGYARHRSKVLSA